MEPAFTLARTADVPGTARLRLAGEFDSDNHAALLAFLLEAVHDPAVARITVDMSATTFIDSSGLRAVESARAAADAAGKALHVLDPAPGVRRLFEIAEMRDMFPAGDRRREQGEVDAEVGASTTAMAGTAAHPPPDEDIRRQAQDAREREQDSREREQDIREQAQDARDERLARQEAVAAVRDQARIERDARDRERDRRLAERERQVTAREAAAEQEIDAQLITGPDAGGQ